MHSGCEEHGGAHAWLLEEHLAYLATAVLKQPFYSHSQELLLPGT
jgi:hypothetical protein